MRQSPSPTSDGSGAPRVASTGANGSPSRRATKSKVSEVSPVASVSYRVSAAASAATWAGEMAVCTHRLTAPTTSRMTATSFSTRTTPLHPAKYAATSPPHSTRAANPATRPPSTGASVSCVNVNTTTPNTDTTIATGTCRYANGMATSATTMTAMSARTNRPTGGRGIV